MSIAALQVPPWVAVLVVAFGGVFALLGVLTLCSGR